VETPWSIRRRILSDDVLGCCDVVLGSPGKSGLGLRDLVGLRQLERLRELLELLDAGEEALDLGGCVLRGWLNSSRNVKMAGTRKGLADPYVRTTAPGR
jgi:hypothetical protein